jgi:hypothetical protein
VRSCTCAGTPKTTRTGRRVRVYAGRSTHVLYVQWLRTNRLRVDAVWCGFVHSTEYFGTLSIYGRMIRALISSAYMHVYRQQAFGLAKYMYVY